MPKKIKKANPVKPETIYRVMPKKIGFTKKKKLKKKKSKQHLRLQTTLPTITVIIILGVALIVATIVFGMGAYLTKRSIYSANKATQYANFDSDTIRRLALIGSNANYPSEIGNFQSAPDDLRDFVLKDYKLLKTNCIVNGEFAGSVNYEIVNVVYDSFARIEKDCAGKDTLVLKKMSGIWTVIFSGNDLPECADVNAFAVPQGITYNCRVGTVTYTNPNP